MSMQYCHTCSTHIDTDFDAEHFEEFEEGVNIGETLCEVESRED